MLALIQEISDREDVVVKKLLESERQQREQKLLEAQLTREREAHERQKRMEEEAAAAAAEAEAWRRCVFILPLSVGLFCYGAGYLLPYSLSLFSLDRSLYDVRALAYVNAYRPYPRLP